MAAASRTRSGASPAGGVIAAAPTDRVPSRSLSQATPLGRAATMRLGHNTNAAFQQDDGSTRVTLKSITTNLDERGGQRWQSRISPLWLETLSGGETKGAFPPESVCSSSGVSTAEDDADALKPALAVIGSGDFGRALAARFVQAGFVVNVGSRDPQRNADLVRRVGAQPRFVDEAVRSSGTVVVAVPKDVYPDLPLRLLAHKTVIDVSNRNSSHRKSVVSQAEYLQSLLPDSHVVKAFNVLSAYALENGGIQGSREVLVAGDDGTSKASVVSLVRACGLVPVDMGGLRAARDIEDLPVQRFPKWKAPFLVSVAIFLIHYLLAIGKYQVCWTLEWGDGSWHWGLWNSLPLDTLNKTLSVHALTMLAACYLPGVLAAYIQLIRGTKYSRFPRWLDKWLRMRKQLGLLMLLSASLHACMSLAVLSPQYNSLSFGSPTAIVAEVLDADVGNGTRSSHPESVNVYGAGGKMDWRGELFVLCGVLSYCLSVILGVTSVPSVTTSLSWKEFSFVQSTLGWLCLALACAHNLFYGWPLMDAPSCHIPSSFQYCMYVPGLTLALKLPLMMPCVAAHLERIRAGFERNSLSLKKNVQLA